MPEEVTEGHGNTAADPVLLQSSVFPLESIEQHWFSADERSPPLFPNKIHGQPLWPGAFCTRYTARAALKRGNLSKQSPLFPDLILCRKYFALLYMRIPDPSLCRKPLQIVPPWKQADLLPQVQCHFLSSVYLVEWMDRVQWDCALILFRLIAIQQHCMLLLKMICTQNKTLIVYPEIDHLSRFLKLR